MAINTEVSRNTYTGNGTSTTFAYTFRIFHTSDLRVLLNGVLQTEGINYTVTGVGEDQGSVIFAVAPPGGSKIVIRRVRPLKQETDIRNVGEFFPEIHEDAFDHFVMLAQQLEDAVSRSLKLQEDEEPTMGVEIPKASERALKWLAFDSTGKPMASTFGASVLGTDTIELSAAAGRGLRLKHDMTAPEKALAESFGAIDLYLRAGSNIIRMAKAAGTVLKFDLANERVDLYAAGETEPRTRLSKGALEFGPGGASSLDIGIVRAGAGVLDQRAGTTPQALRIYNTYTDDVNFERLGIYWSANICTIATLGAGAGAQRDLQIGTDGAAQLLLMTGGTPRWEVTTDGHILARTGDAYDIGSASGGRPRHLYLGGQARASDGSLTSPAYAFASESGLGFYRPSPGVLGIAAWGANVASVSGSAFVVNEDAVNIDFRISGDNKTSCLLIDGSEDEVSVDGRFSLRALTPPQITADQNDYAPESPATSRSSFWRLSSDATRTITGIANGYNGRFLTLWNVGSANIILANESTSSTAVNRILTGTGADITLAPNEGVDLTYDATTQRWRVRAKGYAGSGSGVAGQVTFWTSGSSIGGDSAFTYDATNDQLKIRSTGTPLRLEYDASNYADIRVTSASQLHLKPGGLIYEFGANGQFVPGNSDSFRLGTSSLRWLSLAVSAGSASDPAVSVGSAGVGLHSVSSGLSFATGSTERWRITSAGHLYAVTDNAYDIGANGSVRPRDVFVAGSLSIGNTHATSGALRLAYDAAVASRNSDNTGNLTLLRVGTQNSVANVCFVGESTVGIVGRGRSGSNAPTTFDLPDGSWAVWKDSTSGKVRLYYNDAGTIKSVELTA